MAKAKSGKRSLSIWKATNLLAKALEDMAKRLAKSRKGRKK